MHRQHGGALAKLLVFLLLVVVIASTALYVYVRRDRPLALGAVHVAATGGPVDPPTVELTVDGQVWIASILRNDGRLPVTVRGLGVESGPWVATATGLGDGHDPATVAGFEEVSLDPGEGIGVVVALAADPAARCDAVAATALPSIVVEYATYGITSFQPLDPEGAPPIETPTGCGG